MPSESPREGPPAPWTLGPIMVAPRAPRPAPRAPRPAPGARPGGAAIGDNGRA
jgi:hypothetical protein